jgi:ribosomal protein S18 acetylase RimI-like enzyme
MEEAQQVDAWCREHGIRCLYFLAASTEPNTALAAEQAGFREVDRRVTLVGHASSAAQGEATRPIARALMRPARQEDIPWLECIARESHRTTRFFYDSNFPPAKSEALYQTWIRRSYEGYADRVVVAEQGRRAVGYVSCHLEKDSAGRIGLLAVSSRARGRGIGVALVHNALAWFLAHDVREVSVVTQERNRAAQRLYRHCGFRTRAIETWYHKWYAPPENALG